MRPGRTSLRRLPRTVWRMHSPAALLQEQVAPGLELLASIRRDPQFGPFVMVGAGGTLVELLHDVASAPAPLSHARRATTGTQLAYATLLDGWRGNPARDVDAIVDALVRLSWLAVDLGDAPGRSGDQSADRGSRRGRRVRSRSARLE